MDQLVDLCELLSETGYSPALVYGCCIYIGGDDEVFTIEINNGQIELSSDLQTLWCGSLANPTGLLVALESLAPTDAHVALS